MGAGAGGWGLGAGAVGAGWVGELKFGPRKLKLGHRPIIRLPDSNCSPQDSGSSNWTRGFGAQIGPRPKTRAPSLKFGFRELKLGSFRELKLGTRPKLRVRGAQIWAPGQN